MSMDGVYIPGMEMPKGKEIVLRIDEKGEVYVYGSYPTKLHKAVSVPPHGRLGDLDALENDAQKRLLVCGKNDNIFQKPYEVMRAIALAPTIIPSDGREKT